MSYAELRAKADGNTLLAERQIFSAVKQRGASAVSSLVGPGPAGSFINDTYGQSTKAKEAYSQIVNWVWSCIHVVAKRCAGQNWSAGHFEQPTDGQRRAGPLTAKGYQRSKIPRLRKAVWSEQDIEQDQEHPVLWLLDKPNHVQGKAELIYMMVANLLATGEWYWIGGMVGNNSKKKIELWAVPSSWVVPDHRQGPFRGYILQTGYGTGIPLDPENVARAYFPDPSDPKACMSPLHSCMRAARIDNYILRSQEQSFERGINPNLLVTIGKNIGPDGKPQAAPPRLTGAQRRQIIRAVRHIWSQTVSQGDPAILDGLIDDVKKLQMTPQEMDWQNSGMTVKARILQAFGVNPIVLGEVTPANKAQAVVAESNFLRNVVNPILSGISTAASAFFTPYYEDGDSLAVWLEQAEAHDDEMEFRRMLEGRKLGDVEQDEYRAYAGLPPAEPKEPERSIIFNNPQVLAQIAALAEKVSAGAMTHDNAVQALITALQISKKDADKMMPDDPPEPPPMPAVPSGGVPGAPVAQPEPGKPSAESTPEKPVEEDDDKSASVITDTAPAAEFMFVLGQKSVNTKIARTLVKAAHQAQYRRMERRMQRAMAPFFKNAVASILHGIGAFEPDPEDAEKQAAKLMKRAYDQEKLDKMLADAACQPLADGFIEGAQAERILVAAAMRRRRALERQAGKASTASDALGDFDDEDLDGLDIPTEYPDWLREEAQDFVLRSFSEPYWQRINQTTRDDIQLTLWRAIEDGMSIRDIATRIMEQHGAAYSRARAMMVARTEMTGAMNAGHTEAIRQAYEDIPGVEPAREWLSILGATTRLTHADADGQQQPMGVPFVVGGHECQFPGDSVLPPEERISCQCTILSSFVGEGLSDDENIEEAGYNPDQPRVPAGSPEGGQFGSGGGGGSSGDSDAGDGGGRDASEFKQFKTGAAAEKTLADSASQWSDEDTSDYFANKPIKEYAGTSDSFRINDCMRVKCGDKRLNDTADALSERIARTSFPVDAQAHRSINVKSDEERQRILESFKSKVGKEFTDPAFVSTTANKKYADEWGKKAKAEPLKCTVLVPKGAKAAYLPKTHVGRQEWEILIQRGSKFRVREASDDGIVLELLHGD